MELATLIGHSAQLLRIIFKSSQPSDKIASQYLREKKYIGSHDRRFISEVTFASLRIYRLSEYCSNQANGILSGVKEKIKTIEKSDEYFLEYAILVATCILSNIINTEKYFLAIDEIFFKSKQSNNEDFENNLVFTVSNKFSLYSEQAKEWINQIKEAFTELENQTKLILEKSVLDFKDLEILQNRYSIQDWILKNWVENKFYHHTIKEACGIAESLFYSAPITLRVNSHIISREKVIHELQKENISCALGELSKDAIILQKRVQLNEVEIYKNGLIEVQDEGSQIISFALAPEKNTKVLDACAGAGGKTLHIASIQNDSGRVYANDTEWKRLNALQQRSVRNGFRSIEIIPLSKAKQTNQKLYKNYFNFFDYVLVDAPCSGTGSTRRMPMQKYRLTTELLSRLAKNQLSILEEYSQFVKPGGILVYATCSLMADENDEVIAKFLNKNPNFVTDSISDALNKMEINSIKIGKDDFKLHLLPSIHGCDGFFVARMKRME
ncbi:MAG: methyltransferase domain-containing protein [FCB group bacterium]